MKNLFTVLATVVLLASMLNTHAQVYTAVASGNFTAPSTWQNGSVPPDSVLGGLITIPNGTKVNLDKNLYLGFGSLNIADTLYGSSSLFLAAANVNMGTTGAITVDSVYVDYNNSILNVNNNFAPNKLALANGAIRSTQTGGNINVTNLYIEQGTFSIQLDMTIMPGGHIYLRNTGIPLLSISTFTLNNSYSVTYEQQSHSSGIELLGSGLTDVTVNVGSNNELIATSAIINKGTLKIIDGDYNLGGGKLEISGDGQIDFAGTGVLKSTLNSEIVIDKPGKTLNSQLLFKAGANSFKTLSFNTASDVKLGSDVKVTGTLDLKGGKLNLQGNKLNLLAGGSISNASSSNYIIAEGGGELVNDITPNTSVSFPVGTASNYTPCIITSKNNTAFNGFSVSVLGDVQKQGATGGSITGTQPLVNNTWLFNHTPPNNIALDVELMWRGSQEVNNFDRSNCYISQIVGATWDAQEPAAATESNGMYSLKREGMTHVSALAVFDGNTVDVPQLSKSGEINIYPNPAKNILNIEIGNNQNTNAYIYNIQGQLMTDQELNKAKNSIDISTWPSGMYYLKVSDVGQSIKFTKQ